ncbi:MAG: tetraacyldisaccharide 4'-kinase [Alphaproteobacteria bacterium]|nr:tetraacyldisaccharide 4'-kinase [Alphaproteobacteria bacterium]
MLLKTPKFWYTKTSGTQELPTHFCALSQILKPVSVLYQLGHRLNQKFTKRYKAPLPVICIGNVTAGGSGKTPTCISLSSLIKKSGLFSSPYFLTRGYGGNDTGPRHIEDHDTVHQVGDEPLLLASYSNTIISKNRVDGAKKAHDLGADVIIMDDGLQNMSIDKTLSFMVIDGSMGLGNQLTLPAGPLREPVTRLDTVDLIICNGRSEKNEFSMQIEGDTAVNVKTNEQKPIAAFQQKACHALAGIGNPRRFFNFLERAGVECDTRVFPDHHEYRQDDIQFKDESPVLMTEKDAVKCTKFAGNEHWYIPVKAVPDAKFSECLLKLLREKIDG